MKGVLKTIGAVAIGYAAAKILLSENEKELKKFLDNYYKTHKSEYKTPEEFANKILEIIKNYE